MPQLCLTRDDLPLAPNHNSLPTPPTNQHPSSPTSPKYILSIVAPNPTNDNNGRSRNAATRTPSQYPVLRRSLRPYACPTSPTLHHRSYEQVPPLYRRRIRARTTQEAHKHRPAKPPQEICLSPEMDTLARRNVSDVQETEQEAGNSGQDVDMLYAL